MSLTNAEIRVLVAEAIGDPTGARSLQMADDAIRAAVMELNSQAWATEFEPAESITLLLNVREYPLASPVHQLDSAWWLNAAGTALEAPVGMLPFATFVRAGYFTTTNVGRPDILTYNEETGKIMFSRIPSAAEVGRTVLIAYYKDLPQPPVTVNNPLAGLLVEIASWRLRRKVPGYDWVTDMRIANADKLRERSKLRTVGRLASGRR